MPWQSDADVAKHKKGLDKTRSAKWRSIANAILQDCKDAGKSDADCAPKAIRIANSKS